MIRRLDLPDFGKFRKARLDLGPFTVISGPNEAGKTTVFDALFDTLCAESRHESLPLWKNLAGRYGALRKAELVWEEGQTPLSFGDNEFMEIFAIRGGQLGVHHPDNRKASSWAQAAENALLNSGLNPAHLAKELTKKAETAGKDSVQANIRRLHEAIKDREQAATALKAERDAILAGAEQAVRLEEERVRMAAEAETSAAAVKAKTEEVEKLFAAGRRAAVLAGLKALRELKEARDAAADLKAFANNEIAAYRALKETQLDAEKTAAAGEAALAAAQGAVTAANAALEQLATRETQLRSESSYAAGLASRVAEFASEPERLVTGVDKKLRFSIWGGGALLAVLVAFSGSIMGYLAALAIAGAAGWAGFRFSITERLSGHTPEDVTAFLGGLATEWASVSTEIFPVSDLESARAFLAKAQADCAAVSASYEEKLAGLSELDANVTAAARTAEERRKAAEQAAREANSWFKGRGCATEDEYQAKVADYKRLAARAGDMEQRVLALADGSGCKDEETFKDKLFAENGELERRGVEPAQGAEVELPRLRRELAALAEKAHEAEKDLNRLTAEIERSRAVSGARLGGLPERINLLETELAADKAELAELQLQAEAYTMAAAAFTALAESSAVAFETLGKEVTGTLRAMLPEAYAEFKVFEADGAAVTDAGGIKRQVRNLSAGMRDLFMLAARLAIAHRSRLTPEGLAPALLVLDEPFYTLDAARQTLALKLLAAFHRTTGWQFIILTKEPGLAAAAEAEGVKVTEVKLPAA